MKIFLPCVLFFMVACTFTTSMPLRPAFRVGIDTVGSYLDSIVPARHFSFDGIRKSVNDSTTRLLEITVTNGKNIPSDDQAFRSLAKTIAVYVKSQLKDPAEYNVYDVHFESRKESNGVTSASSNTIEFKTSEL